jgi:pimeloyl-ACP methyl ester carboxylesterase
MPLIDTPRGELFYATKRDSDGGPVLVLVHGAGGSHLHWPAQLRRLSGATVHSLDLPGHGRSQGSGCDTIEGYVAALVAFFDGVGLSSAVVVGHSMGGAIAQKLALAQPERVQALVLVGTGAKLRVAPAILEGVKHDFDQVVDLITRYAWSAEADPALKNLGREALRQTGPEVLLSDFLACDRFDIMDRVSEIDVPALVIGGTSDKLTPIKYSRFLAEQMPNAQLTIVEGAGHMVMLERPEETVSALREFALPTPTAS